MESHNSVPAFHARVVALGLEPAWDGLVEMGLDTEGAFASMFFEDSPDPSQWKAALDILLPPAVAHLGAKVRSLWLET